jgi:hypothetical protein
VGFRSYRGSVPKKERVWLASAAKLAESYTGDLSGMNFAQRGRKPTNADRQTPARFLVRRRGSQGAPYKAPLIREYLWDRM